MHWKTKLTIINHHNETHEIEFKSSLESIEIEGRNWKPWGPYGGKDFMGEYPHTLIL